MSQSRCACCQCPSRAATSTSHPWAELLPVSLTRDITGNTLAGSTLKNSEYYTFTNTAVPQTLSRRGPSGTGLGGALGTLSVFMRLCTPVEYLLFSSCGPHLAPGSPRPALLCCSHFSQGFHSVAWADSH